MLDFPAVYYYVPATFAVHKDSPISTIAGFNGKTIGVCGSCTYETYLKHNLVLDVADAPKFEYQAIPGKIKSYETDT